MQLFVVTFAVLLAVAAAAYHPLGHKEYQVDGLSENDRRDIMMMGNSLVTLRPKYVISLMQCAKMDDHMCMEFAQCESHFDNTPLSDAVRKCHQMLVPHRTTKCFQREPAFLKKAGSEYELYDCVIANTAEFTPEEKRQIIEFEDCGRNLLKHECHAPKPYHASHYRKGKKLVSFKDMYYD